MDDARKAGLGLDWDSKESLLKTLSVFDKNDNDILGKIFSAKIVVYIY